MKSKKKLIVVFRDLNHWGHKQLITSLSIDYEIVLFYYYLDEDSKTLLEEFGINYQKIKIDKLPKYAEILLSLITKPPRSESYNVHLKRNILRNYSKKNHFLYLFHRYFPKVLSVDQTSYLIGYLKTSFDFDIKRIKPDSILYISRFLPYYYHISRAKHLGVKINSWIYSWDNPFKDRFLPTYFDKYFVWNNEMQTDLIEIHGLSPKNICKVGSVNFDYLKNLNAYQDGNRTDFIELVRKNRRKYFVYMFGTGYDPAIFQEMEMVIHFSKIIYKIEPTVTLVVRPYPDNKFSTEIYSSLEKMPNIYVQKGLKQLNSQNQQTIFEKIALLDNSLLNINALTTMGLEASFFKAPVIQIDYFPGHINTSKKRKFRVLDVDVLMQNKHIQNYLVSNEYPNVVKNDEELRNVIKDVVINKIDHLMDYSDMLQSFSNPFKDDSASRLLTKSIH
jgi:hypothetical protein